MQPDPKDLALTGGTGINRSIGGDDTLVEFGNGKGKLTLHVLSLVPRGGDACARASSSVTAARTKTAG